MRRPGTVAVLGIGLGLIWGCGDSSQSVILYNNSPQGVTVKGQPGKRGEEVAFKDEIVVSGKGSFARLRLDDQTKIVLVPDAKGGDTHFTLDGMKPKSTTPTLLLKLPQGTAGIIVPKDRKSKDIYEVEAANTTTAIRGTQLRISSGPDGDQIAVKEGDVEVRDNDDEDKTATVSGGQQVTFDKSKAAFQPPESYNPMAGDEESIYQEPKHKHKNVEQ